MSNTVSIDGFFKDTKHGEVFQTREINLTRWGKVEVGTVIEAEDDETAEPLGRSFVVAAIGKPFYPGTTHKTKFVYLYLTEPVSRPSAVVVPREHAEVDGAMAQLEDDDLQRRFSTEENDG